MKDRLYIKVTAMLMGIVVLSVAVTAFIAPRGASSAAVRVVTSFYPVYIAAQNVVGEVDGVEVVNMVGNTAGCLHDYALEPQLLVLLEDADVFVMNGAGAEPFLEAAIAARPFLNVIDLSAGQSLLESGHMHDHEHGEEQAHEAAAVNSHLWVSPLRYRQQVQTLCDGLVAADPAHAREYKANTAAYVQQIDAVWARMQQAVATAIPSVLYHDSLLYLAEDLQLAVAASLNIGEDSGADPTARAAAEEALRDASCAWLWYDDQYDVDPQDTLHDLAKKTVVLSVDTCVSGNGDKTQWIRAMNTLCETMEAAA